MADPSDPPRLPAPPPGGYLPRIAKFADEPADERGGSSRSHARGKGKSKEASGKSSSAEPEVIPAHETAEGRRRARIIVAGVAATVVAGLAFLLFLALSRGHEDLAIEETSPGGPDTTAQSAEDTARDLLRRARDAGRVGNGEQALAFLQKIQATYPRTTAAEEAQEALDRAARRLPLFVDGPAITAVASEPPRATDPPPGPEVVALPPGVATQPGGVDVEVVRPRPTLGPKAPAGSSLPRSEVEARPLPPDFRPLLERGVHASGWPLEIVSERDGAVMVLVPGSACVIGRDDGPPAERPSRQVVLSTFYMDQHEATARQYGLFRTATGRLAPRATPSVEKDQEKGGNAPPENVDDRPVVMVTHEDALAYAAWAGKSLPTEAQWELASRTIDGRIHPWGTTPPPWDQPRASRHVDPIFTYPGDMSPYGIFDLAGNAWEWTADWFDAKALQHLKPGTQNPSGPSRSPSRLPERSVRGGSKDWSTTWRTGLKPETRLPYLGFRCTWNVEAAGPDGTNAGPRTNAPQGTTRPPPF